MADRTFASLIPRINPNVPGCPQPLMEQAVRHAAIRTCERTLVWRHAEPEFAVSPGVHQYFYRKPQDADVHVVFAAMVNGSPLERLTLEQALMKYPDWADLYNGVPFEDLWATSGSLNETAYNELSLNGGATFQMPESAMEGASEPRSITQLTPDQYILLPLPDDEREYKLRLMYALKPKRNAAGMPQYLFDELEDTLYHGALQELLVMPSEAWKDRELATYHARQYLYCVTERRARANLGVMRGTMTVQMRPFT
jgi:hypothetical protein